MQFSKRTFKIHPNCLWNFYGKKKTKQKKMLLAGQKKSQSRKLTETSAARLSSSKSWKASCVVPLPQSCLSCCDVVIGQPVNNQTAFIYTMCSDMAQHLFFFLIDHGSALQDHETLYLLSFRREEEIRQQISGSVQDIEELSVGWMSGAWPDRKNIL